MPWEYIELRDNVVDRPVACASTRDAEQKVNLREPQAAAFSPTRLGISDRLQEATWGGVEGVQEQTWVGPPETVLR